ncbi:Cobalamin biosynthesis protein CbiG [Pyrobaculum oguniense TE7]|uniref:Cobalamin biosynthesis protein CbiG n=1 Tax=Pyrobaculum oguniense (strain DSM 13380 / JCM 10595 / TE7) TaxID=698757 RepID=H6QAB9_PYROT|nr:Cobalamin biosynthesis protein CbiG [Pyrobaculum oguniense TE7]
MLRLWLGVAVVYSSDAGKPGAEAVANALRRMRLPAAVFHYKDLDAAWGCYDAYVFVMAMGGVVRTLCKRLRDKAKDPPVVVVSHDLKYIVPLLGMHRGANELSQRLAEALGGVAVVTTVAEQRGFAPLEEVERLLLCSLQQEDKLEIYRRLIKGEEVCIDAEVSERLPGYRVGSGCPVAIKLGCEGRFCCKRWKIYAGFGATSRATAMEIAEAIKMALKEVGASGVETVASVKEIVDEVARILGVRGVLLRPSDLPKARCLSPPSPLAVERLGVGNVAEASALAAAGAGGWLIYRKRGFERRVTVALAANI